MSFYPKLIIYYFSGTGNAKNVALTLQQEAQAKGIEAQLINLSLTKRFDIDLPDNEALIAFISPVHGFIPVTIEPESQERTLRILHKERKPLELEGVSPPEVGQRLTPPTLKLPSHYDQQPKVAKSKISLMLQ